LINYIIDQGFGINEVSVLSTPSRFLSPNKHPVSSANHDSPPHYHDDGNLSDKPIVVGSSRGKVMGIDSESGEQIWKYSCSGSWYSMPVAIVEPPSLEDGRIDQLVYIGAGKSVHCLKASTGDVVWTCRVSNAKLGSNHMTLATPWSSRLAAEAYSAFSQNPTAQAAIRQREEASSGGG
jgi:outer membrane protein assembly factor BamB